MAVPATFKEYITLTEIGKDTFETRYNPIKMGNLGSIAFGGCAISAALKATFHTIPEKSSYRLYSMTGYYLGPSLIDRKLTCAVKRVRDTRTFATRTVEVSQEMDGGKGKRTVLIATADFQAPEPAMFMYSTPPTRNYGGIDEQLYADEWFRSLVSAKKLPQKVYEAWRLSFQLFTRFFEQKPCKEGIFAQTAMGIGKDVQTTQDHLPLVEKSSADWFRIKHPLTTDAEQLAATNFAMDTSLSFVPLSHNHQFLDDSGACSSLDFALRVFSNRVDLSKWHLREMTTVTGAEGRTYSEGRLWDSEGNMIANMTQQSIMRVKKEATAKI